MWLLCYSVQKTAVAEMNEALPCGNLRSPPGLCLVQGLPQEVKGTPRGETKAPPDVVMSGRLLLATWLGEGNESPTPFS